jgi:manganese/zinc/iron transport system permease protein
MLDLLSDFTVRTVVMGAAVLGVVSGTLGTFALLRRQSLLGDALSHAALPGVCLGYLVSGSRALLPILGGALLAGIAAGGTMLLVTRRSRVKEDAALGIVLSLYFALGTVMLTYIQHQNRAGQAGLDTFLFGQAAAILPGDVLTMGLIGLFAVGLLVLGWKEVKLVTFDPAFARTQGLPVTVIDVGLTALVACAVVVGLQMVGVVLMSAMLIAPAAAARQWTNKLGSMVALSALMAVAAGVTGALISAHGEGLATGPVMVLCASVLVVISIVGAPGRGVAWRVLRVWRTSRNLRAQSVLLGLHQLARQHGDPQYPSERGMIDALFGSHARRSLRQLEEKGLVRRVTHMAEEGEHWMMTEDGLAEAQRATRELNLGQASAGGAP